eukprot:tig00000381_g24546.t1
MYRGPSDPQPAHATSSGDALAGVGEGEADFRKADSKGRTVSGAYFTLLGLALTAIAVSFVAAQFFTANYQIVQSLNPGSSPSVGSISGAFAVSATMRGYSGLCAPASDGISGVAFVARGFSSSGTLATAATDGGRSCKGCRITSSSEAGVNFRFRSRLAFAVSVAYAVALPEGVSASGTIATSVGDVVFRGTEPVTLPVELTPTHFSSDSDGRPRYLAAVTAADARVAQRDAASFVRLPVLRHLSRVALAEFELELAPERLRRLPAPLVPPSSSSGSGSSNINAPGSAGKGAPRPGTPRAMASYAANSEPGANGPPLSLQSVPIVAGSGNGGGAAADHLWSISHL